MLFRSAKRVNFDFQQILDRRASIARQREKLYDERSKRAASASSLSVCSVDSKAVRPTQAQMETTIRKDTEVNKSDPGLKPPRKR